MNKIQPDVDAPPALGWLAKLESRQENVRSKLAHELGAGAPCNNCNRCTGLDLHFWRKACRVCKCRGEQHDCPDDDLSGWMQFEILGQKRSQPAYVNIKSVPEPLRLDWIPPNTDTNLAAEYMDQMETENIPITGSKAAIKRKERLKYQVPIHDLDASLCHNLSENEATQLTQYVGKIKEHNVGQGVVVRVGDAQLASIEYLMSPSMPFAKATTELPDKFETSVHKNKLGYARVDPGAKPTSSGMKYGEIAQLEGASTAVIHSNPLAASLHCDKILSFILTSKAIQTAIYHPSFIEPNSKLVLSKSPLESKFEGNAYLSNSDKLILQNIGVDQQALQSVIINGPIYDKLFQQLDNCSVDYRQCCILQPMKALRLKYNNGNDYNFRNNVGSLAAALEEENPVGAALEANVETLIDPKLPPPSNYPNYATPPRPNRDAKIDLEALVDALQISDNTSTPVTVSQQTDAKPIVNRSKDIARPKPVTTCKTCKEPIYAGTVAVKAHRAGNDVAWHPKCFTCHKCGDLLADLVYFYHHGNIYCGRDLAEKLKIPRCQACDELIFTKEYTAAEGATFHIKHFCCYQCDTPLGGQQYIPEEKTNMPLCLICYDRYHAEKCQNCSLTINPTEEAVRWQESHWHMRCFNCAGAQCGRSLIGGKFCIKLDMPFCSSKCVSDSHI